MQCVQYHAANATIGTYILLIDVTQEGLQFAGLFQLVATVLQWRSKRVVSETRQRVKQREYGQNRIHKPSKARQRELNDC